MGNHKGSGSRTGALSALLKAFPRQRDQRIKERRNFAAMHECGGVLVFGRRQRRDTPQAQLAGVQKAPRHEVAGSWAPARQRALWGFNAYRGTEDSAVGVSAGVKRRNGRGGNLAERLHNFRVLA